MLPRDISANSSARAWDRFANIMPGFGAPTDTTPPNDLDYDIGSGPRPAAVQSEAILYHFRWVLGLLGGQMTNLGAHEIDVVQWACR